MVLGAPVVQSILGSTGPAERGGFQAVEYTARDQPPINDRSQDRAMAR